MEPGTKNYSPSDVPILHDSDRYEFIKNIGSGNFGMARLMRDKQVDELVAIKYIERGNLVRFAFSLQNISICLYFTIETGFLTTLTFLFFLGNVSVCEIKYLW